MYLYKDRIYYELVIAHLKELMTTQRIANPQG